MTKTFRKLIGLMLCVCLLLPCLPAVALGEAKPIQGRPATATETIIWEDEDNFDGLRPDSVVGGAFNYDNYYLKDIEAPADGGNTWSVSWDDLPAFDSEGNRYVYSSPDSFYNDYLLSKRKDSEVITVRKVWREDETPRDITVEFLRDGVRYMEPLTLTASNNYTDKWTSDKGFYSLNRPKDVLKVEVSGETDAEKVQAITADLYVDYCKTVYYVPEVEYRDIGGYVKTNEGIGFTAASGLAFDVYWIARESKDFSNFPNGWEAAGVFANDENFSQIFKERVSSGDSFSVDLLREAKRVIDSKPEGLKRYKELVMDEKGAIESQMMRCGIYYARRREGTGNPLLNINPFVFSVTWAKKGALDIVIDSSKFEYIKGSPVTVSVSKTWKDGGNSQYRPPEGITVNLTKKGSKETTQESKPIPLAKTVGENEIATWNDLPAFDEYGEPYQYSISEPTVTGYDSKLESLTIQVSLDEAVVNTYGYKNITVEVLKDGNATDAEKKQLTSDNKYTCTWQPFKEDVETAVYTVKAAADGLDAFGQKRLTAALKVSYSYALVNTLKEEKKPERGSLQVAKQLKIDGKAPTSANNKLVEGMTFHFKIEGPLEEKGKDMSDYLDGKEVDRTLDITIPEGYKGEIKYSAIKENLPVGSYTITEYVEDDWKDKGMLVEVGSVTLKVEKDKTTTPTQAETIINNQTTGKLELTKTVLYDYDKSKAPNNNVVNATFNFQVKGPDPQNTYDEIVSIKINNQHSRTVEVPGRLLPGKYTIKELGYTDMPESKKWQTFVTPEPTVVEVKAGSTASTAKGNLINYLVTTAPPSNPQTTSPSNTTPSGGGGGGGTTRTRTTPPPDTTTTTPPPGQTTPPSNTTPPPSTEPPENTPTPEPTPTPTPATNVTIRKVWDDDSNTHRTRPASITVQLLRNGEQINMASMTGTGDTWSFTFSNLPAVDQNGTPYNYLARELSVNGYTTELNGTTITNHLIRKPPERYISISGIKIWRDMDNASGQRPNQIVVRLMRDGVEVERRTVTSLQNWQFSFNNIPEDDGFGNKYTYTIQEEAVNGYFARFEGSTITNSRLPERPYMPPATGEEIDYETFRDTGTPLAGFPMGEGDLEELLTLYDYPMPLWGEPMKTGDEMPIYPIIFGSVGLCALVAVIVLSNMEKKKKRKGA